MKDRGLAWLALAALVCADGAAWFQILTAGPPRAAAISFLDVGQGDASLLILPGGAKILTDAGPDAAVVAALEVALPSGARYIDLAVVTHPELDHFNGFNHILEKYEIGAFIVNGRDHPGSRQWAELVAKIEARRAPLITLGAGDGVRHGANRIDILSPGPQFVGSSELNDTGLVQKILTPDFSALLTADTGFNVEEYLRERYDLAADILKVGHHGSKYSSSAAFLRAARPEVAVISSGARNTYGHPARETLARLSAADIPVLRTDQMGTVTLRRVGGKLKAFTVK
ncbi:MAG: hypothetical protein A2855_02390 [Candidatus Liptonbacteria bacterium RIFCSPHIGHO2_01_FULL_57_28]|uniref:Metallo-beta-lactamase domain-containing protein n=1 Tax=Candidatus Liptonbacteria bacterium RIFCSPHIGHO2_01_FULL_57_28 TaxID=1798647 RepID=A0A1G2C9D3_9BACT|nr:MAG: hypothetical protein A2855_02390 [Candidatus Liptonbacteria bacterium RIFCSPHIGHO2_01_FULL_57_28]